MQERFKKHIDLSISRYPKLEGITPFIISAYKVIEVAFSADHKLLVAGNGSAADSEHIAGELMKRFKIPRPVTFDFASRLIEK